MTALVSELELPAFDHTDESMRGERFHRAMAEVRAEGWLAQGPYGYIALDRESAEFFLRTRSAIFPGMKIAEIFGVTEGPLYEQMKRNILHVNGADHTRLRSLVNPALSARAVERYRPAMQGFMAGLLEQALAAGAPASANGAAAGEGVVRCEFVEAFAKPYPSLVIAQVMGAPVADAPRLHHWSNWIQRQFDATSMATEMAEIEQAVAEFGRRWIETLRRVSRERGFTPPTRESFMADVGPLGALYVGSPETVAQKIVANLRTLEASRFDLKFGMPGMSQEAVKANVELYGNRVIPRVRELWADREPQPSSAGGEIG